jgi:hypothetical protein
MRKPRVFAPGFRFLVFVVCVVLLFSIPLLRGSVLLPMPLLRGSRCTPIWKSV